MEISLNLICVKTRSATSVAKENKQLSLKLLQKEAELLLLEPLKRDALLSQLQEREFAAQLVAISATDSIALEFSERDWFWSRQAEQHAARDKLHEREREATRPATALVASLACARARRTRTQEWRGSTLGSNTGDEGR